MMNRYDSLQLRSIILKGLEAEKKYLESLHVRSNSMMINNFA